MGPRSYHWRMDGRQILVTGAGGGIGGATADELARLGAHVFCADVDEARASATAQRTGGTAVVLDVSDLDAAERAVRAVARRRCTASSTLPASARARRSRRSTRRSGGGSSR